MHPRISLDPEICHGKACVRGTRIPVSQVLGMLASGDSIEEILEDFPSLEPLDIRACLAYGTALAEEQMTPLEMASSNP